MNLYGEIGPRCHPCSGLGSVLLIPPDVGKSIVHATQCKCKGTGVDFEEVQRQHIESLVDRIERMERQQISDAKKLNALQTMIRKGTPKNSRQTWVEALYVMSADYTAYASSAAEAIIVPNVVFPANYMQDARRIRIRLFGKLSTTGTPTMTFGIRWNGVGGTLLAVTEAITNGSGVSNVNWELEAYIQTRMNGATGALLASGRATVHTASTTVVNNIFSVSGFDAPANVTVDLTADTPLAITGTWSASSSSNTLTAMDYHIESLN